MKKEQTRYIVKRNYNASRTGADAFIKLIQLKNQGKKLEKTASIKERKKRTHRLIERGAILESFIEDASELSGSEIKAILEKVFSKNKDEGKTEL